MNATVDFAAMEDGLQWVTMNASVNVWRGEAIHWFARAEYAVGETLLTMKKAGRTAGNIRLPHLFGQRLDALATAIDINGSFADVGMKVREALPAFREHEELRQFLCHGATKICRDRTGRWVILMKILTFSSGKDLRKIRPLEQGEAEKVLETLKQSTKKLEAALQSLRASLLDLAHQSKTSSNSAVIDAQERVSAAAS